MRSKGSPCRVIFVAVHQSGEGGNAAQSCDLHVALRMVLLEVIYNLHPLWDASVLIKVSGDDGLAGLYL